MVIGIFGESCTGKSTLAEELRRELDARVYTGRDYLRLARDQASARRAFQALLEGARCGEHVIWVISEQEDLALLPEGSLRVLVTAGLPEIKVRFARRMGGERCRLRWRPCWSGSTAVLTGRPMTCM